MAKSAGGRIVRDGYERVGPRASWRDRLLNVAKWALIGAAVSALVAGLAILTGGMAVPAGISLAAFLAKIAATGAVEGLLYAGAHELMGKKKADAAVQAALAENTNDARVEASPALNNDEVVLVRKQPAHVVNELELK